MKTYQVKSIFGPTIQGEGSHVGTCVLFLRFAGCNRWSGLEKDRARSFCRFCDTDFRGGNPMTAQGIAAALNDLSGPKTVVITGGEPTLQIDKDLLLTLRENGFAIHLETNGSKSLGELLPLIDHVTMSPKQGRAQTKLESCDDLKILFPLSDPLVTPDAFSDFPAKQKFLQPIAEDGYEINRDETLAFIFRRPEWRLSLQTHKILGVE
jgi:organic radical activating enzyme|nr:7-carboxy-7-deazaguanine synthase [Bdellovibrio sp. HAGR004]